MPLKNLLDSISDEIRSLTQTVRNHTDSRLHKFATITNIVLAVVSAIVLSLTVWIQLQTATLHKETVELGKKTIRLQEKTEGLQKEILISQQFFKEIETRPYLLLQIKDVQFTKGQNIVNITIEFINKGKVPARNIILSESVLNYKIEEERNWDIISGGTVGMRLSFGPKEKDVPLEKELAVLFSASYEGMKKDTRKYRSLIAGKIKEKNGEGHFDPIAIKIDEAATAYEFGFTALNKEKKDGQPIRWPKLRQALSE